MTWLICVLNADRREDTDQTRQLQSWCGSTLGGNGYHIGIWVIVRDPIVSTLSHIVSFISRDNPGFVYVILSFPPFGY